MASSSSPPTDLTVSEENRGTKRRALSVDEARKVARTDYLQPRKSKASWGWLPALILAWCHRENVPPMPGTQGVAPEDTLPSLSVHIQQAFAALVAVMENQFENLGSAVAKLMANEGEIVKEVEHLKGELGETDRLHGVLTEKVYEMDTQHESTSELVKSLEALLHTHVQKLQEMQAQLDYQVQVNHELRTRLGVTENRSLQALTRSNMAMAEIHIHHPIVNTDDEQEPEEEEAPDDQGAASDVSSGEEDP